MAEELTVVGTVVAIERKDGESAKGPWTKWGFNIADTNGGRHWYSWFDEAGAQIKTGQGYRFHYTTSPNPKNTQYPYRKIKALLEILETPPPGTDAPVTNGNQYHRSKEEMRWTEALHMATRMAYVGDEVSGREAALLLWAEWFYRQLDIDEHEPEDTPESAHLCHEHGIKFDCQHPKSGEWYHEFGQDCCVEGRGLVPRTRSRTKPVPQE